MLYVSPLARNSIPRSIGFITTWDANTLSFTMKHKTMSMHISLFRCTPCFCQLPQVWCIACPNCLFLHLRPVFAARAQLRVVVLDKWSKLDCAVVNPNAGGLELSIKSSKSIKIVVFLQYFQVYAGALLSGRLFRPVIRETLKSLFREGFPRNPGFLGERGLLNRFFLGDDRV